MSDNSDVAIASTIYILLTKKQKIKKRRKRRWWTISLF